MSYEEELIGPANGVKRQKLDQPPTTQTGPMAGYQHQAFPSSNALPTTSTTIPTAAADSTNGVLATADATNFSIFTDSTGTGDFWDPALFDFSMFDADLGSSMPETSATTTMTTTTAPASAKQPLAATLPPPNKPPQVASANFGAITAYATGTMPLYPEVAGNGTQNPGVSSVQHRAAAQSKPFATQIPAVAQPLPQHQPQPAHRRIVQKQPQPAKALRPQTLQSGQKWRPILPRGGTPAVGQAQALAKTTGQPTTTTVPSRPAASVSQRAGARQDRGARGTKRPAPTITVPPATGIPVIAPPLTATTNERLQFFMRNNPADVEDHRLLKAIKIENDMSAVTREVVRTLNLAILGEAQKRSRRRNADSAARSRARKLSLIETLRRKVERYQKQAEYWQGIAVASAFGVQHSLPAELEWHSDAEEKEEEEEGAQGE